MAKSGEKCSICLDIFKEPKGLPCFHTFCKECLQMFIDQDSSTNKSFINCPMCRAETKPSDASKPRKEWAKLFPTNNYVLNQYSLGYKQRECPTHSNEVLEISCKTCKEIICGQCCLSTHEKCEKTLTEINAKMIRSKLLGRQGEMEENLAPLKNRLVKLKQKKEFTETKVKQMAQELCNFISDQEKYWLQEIDAAHSRESSTLQEQQKDLDEIIGKAKDNIEDLDKLVGVDDPEDEPKSLTTFDYQPRHTLMTIKTGLVQLKEVTVDFQISQDFVKVKDKLLKENMLDKFENTASAEKPASAEITVAGGGASGAASVGAGVGASAGARVGATAVHTAMETSVAAAPEPIFTEDTAIPHPFQFITSITLNRGQLTGINDLVMLPDQSFLISEACFRKVWKFSILGEYMHNTNFDSEPHGICILQDNLCAVSLPYNKKISFLSCSDLTVKNNISFQKKYYGLATNDAKRVFALYRAQTICVDIISKNNTQSAYEISYVIQLPSMFYFCDDYRLRVLPSGSVLIITPASVLNLVCIDRSGTVTFNYKGEVNNLISSVADFAVSRNFIYVADKTTNKIHRIGHQGNLVDIPLTSKDGILEPKKIVLNNTGVLAVLSKSTQAVQIKIYSS